MKSLTEVKQKQQEAFVHFFTQDRISHQALVPPLVSTCNGDLFQKQTIIEFLLPDDTSSLNKKEAEEYLEGRVKSLKDVVELEFETSHDEKTDSDKFVCPITGKELGPSVKAVYIVPCGHVFSQEAMHELKEPICPQCQQTYEARDIVPILPQTDAEKESVMRRIQDLQAQGLTHSLKPVKKDKSKKSKRKAEEIEEIEETLTNGAKMLRQNDKSTSKISGVQNETAAKLTAATLNEIDAKKKRRVEESENIKSLYTKQNGSAKKNTDFMNRGYSIH